MKEIKSVSLICAQNLCCWQYYGLCKYARKSQYLPQNDSSHSYVWLVTLATLTIGATSMIHLLLSPLSSDGSTSRTSPHVLLLMLLSNSTAWGHLSVRWTGPKALGLMLSGLQGAVNLSDLRLEWFDILFFPIQLGKLQSRDSFAILPILWFFHAIKIVFPLA
jgi:hypothetical protein